jgi:molybdopterin converting factor subunit 1
MNVRVLLFASYAEAAGRSEVTLELPEGAKVSDVVAEVQRLAKGSTFPPRPLLAVNATYAQPDRILNGGDEVAIIPPVAGG